MDDSSEPRLAEIRKRAREVTAAHSVAEIDRDTLLSIIDSRTSNPATEELIAAAKEVLSIPSHNRGSSQPQCQRCEAERRLRSAIENAEKVK